MAAHPPRRAMISVLVSVPALGSLGGGLVAMGHSGNLTLLIVIVLIVTAGPLAICGLLGCLLVHFYRAEKKRYLDADRGNRRAIREYDMALADLVVSLLTRTRSGEDPPSLERRHRRAPRG
jgi:hypothetical protein